MGLHRNEEGPYCVLNRYRWLNRVSNLLPNGKRPFKFFIPLDTQETIICSLSPIFGVPWLHSYDSPQMISPCNLKVCLHLLPFTRS